MGDKQRLSLVTGWWIGGVVVLAACVVLAVLLALGDMQGLALPGCGPESACASLKEKAGDLAKVPVIGWPVSFVGVGYFAGVLLGWVVAAGHRPRLGVVLLEVGWVVSLFYLGLMVKIGVLCPYCVALHGLNLSLIGFVLAHRRALRARTRDVAERTPAKRTKRARSYRGSLGVAVGVAVFFVATGATGLADALLQDRQDRVTAIERQATTDEIIERSGGEVDDDASAVIDDAAETEESQLSEDEEREISSEQGKGGFTGRYRLGPEDAAVRVVVYSDYQCPLCRAVEAELMRLVEQHPETMSLSAKHFPFSSTCNPYVGGANPHPNACWAARAVEAAGAIGGNEAFWEMHRWLFAQRGSFTDASLPGSLREMGYDPAQFQQVMMSEQIDALVHHDIEEGAALGLVQTPTVFVNGVELRGVQRADQVREMLERVLASEPEPGSAAGDWPMSARERVVDVWATNPVTDVAVREDAVRFGEDGADAVRVVVFGDYREDATVKVDATLRALVGQRDDVVYEYRFFPFERACNPRLPRDGGRGGACLAARAAAAAQRMGGAEAGWAMHAWLMERGEEAVDEQAVIEAAQQIGLDEQAFGEALASDEVEQAVAADVAAAWEAGLRRIPMILVAGRKVGSWDVQGNSVLGEIVDRAQQAE